MRELRDSAGFGAKTVQAIAAENGIPKPTLWAALRGQRIPSAPVLAALVRAWGGDEVEWARRRTRVESEIEALRRAKPTIGQATPQQLPTDVIMSILSKIGQQSDEPGGEQTFDQLRAQLLGHEPDPEEARQAAIKRRLDRLAAEKTIELNSGNGLVAVILSQRKAVYWDVLREQAGSPSLREISRSVNVNHSTVGSILKGDAGYDRQAERVCRYLLERRDRLIRQFDQPCPPGEEQNFPPPL
ncbi:hypothetical protein [Streptomyces sp. NPDC003719]